MRFMMEQTEGLYGNRHESSATSFARHMLPCIVRIKHSEGEKLGQVQETAFQGIKWSFSNPWTLAVTAV
jgi:hypothetical protein